MEALKTFSVARSETLVDNIARNLIGFIASNEMAEGDKLPSERQLVEQIDASRLPLREALCMLKGLGVIQAHQGKGVFVKQVDLKNIFTMLSPLLQVQRGISISDIMAVRYYLEPAIAIQAAEHRNEEDIREMQNCFQQMQENISDKKNFITPDLEFHTALARATGNMLFDLFVSVMHDLILQVQETFPDQEASRKKSVQYHAEVLEAIINKDGQSAAEAMKKHIQDIERAICPKKNSK